MFQVRVSLQLVGKAKRAPYRQRRRLGAGQGVSVPSQPQPHPLEGELNQHTQRGGTKVLLLLRPCRTDEHPLPLPLLAVAPACLTPEPAPPCLGA